MPPKKKKGKKKKKKNDGELTIDDKYKKTLREIEALKDHLDVRKDLVRRSQYQSEEWKSRMKEVEADLEEQQHTQRAVSADMTRQYKTMQTDMELQIYKLENALGRTRTQLEKTEVELKTVKDEKEKMEREKDHEISQLKQKIDTMGMQYEHVLNSALDKLIDKLDVAKNSWEEKSTLIQSRNKQTLRDFGLDPLCL